MVVGGVSLKIHTPIYGKITLNEAAEELLSTYELQRIDRISIGAAFFSYPFKPGYSRLEHSIGVAYLAQKLCKQLGIEADRNIGLYDVISFIDNFIWRYSGIPLRRAPIVPAVDDAKAE